LEPLEEKVFGARRRRQLLHLWFVDGANAFTVLTDAAHSLIFVRIAAANWTRKSPFLVVNDLEDFHVPAADYAHTLPIADRAQCRSTRHLDRAHPERSQRRDAQRQGLEPMTVIRARDRLRLAA